MEKIQTIVRLCTTTDEAESYRIAAHEEKVFVFIVDAKKDMHVTVHLQLTGEESHATMYGIVIPHSGAHVVFETYQEHMSPQSQSFVMVKSLMHDAASFDFLGTIRIEKHARHADAYQKNMNLLIGPYAHVTSQPILEIRHNDVACSHGVWTSPLPTEPMWYMNTRGISVKEAKRLYIEGFIHDIMIHIQDKHIRDMISREIHNV